MKESCVRGANLRFLTFFLLEIFIPDAAEQAFLRVAVVLFELDKGLAVAGMGSGEATFLPQADDVIVFRFQLFQQVAGSFDEPFFPFVLSIGIKERHHGVDNQQVDGSIAESLRTGRRRFTEYVVSEPVERGTSPQQVAQLFHGRSQQELGKHPLGMVIEVGQLGDAHVRKIARTHAEHLPAKMFGGMQFEFMGQVSIFLGKLGRIVIGREFL